MDTDFVAVDINGAQHSLSIAQPIRAYSLEVGVPAEAKSAHIDCPKGRPPNAFPRQTSARPIVPQMPMFGALIDPEGACLL